MLSDFCRLSDEYCGAGFSFLMTEFFFPSLSCVAVEREVVQKRTFTRWMNLHLEKVCGWRVET